MLNLKKEEISSLDIINSYIKDPIDFKLNSFCKKHNIDSKIFSLCVLEVKEKHPDVYDIYYGMQSNEVRKKLEPQISKLNVLLTAISTGVTPDGSSFDVFEFYKLAPCKSRALNDGDFGDITRRLSSNYPHAMGTFQSMKQDYRLEMIEKEQVKTKEDDENSTDNIEQTNKLYIGTYSERLYLFTKWLLGDEQAEILKEYMKINGITTITPIGRYAEKSVYKNATGDALFTSEDSDYIFDIMMEKKYPQIREIYDIFKKDLIISRKKAKSQGTKTLGLLNPDLKSINE